MTLKSSKCSERIYTEPSVCRKKEFKSSVMKIVDPSWNSSLLATGSICSVPASEDGFHLDKRRKIDEECNSLQTNVPKRESTARSLTTSECNSSLGQNSSGKSLTLSASIEVSNSGENTFRYKRECQVHEEVSVEMVLRNSAGSHSDIDNGQQSSTSCKINHRTKDAWECSSPDAYAAQPVTVLISARDLCISILKQDIFPTKESELRHQSSPDDNERSSLFECMTCGSMEDPSKMLICDRCDKAFHLSCWKPRVKKIPQEEWYCQVCSKKKPKRQRGKLMSPKREIPKPIQRPRRGLGTIQEMLVHAEPYETEVRIGRDFQADVPEWSGPICSSEDQFPEPSELDPSETSMMGRLPLFKDKKSSVGNWLQCREVLDSGVVCGKWRRAPLFVVQSVDWDCSCSVIWDPIHADCAVPQELDTDEVLKQLKYINKLKERLGDGNKKR